MGSQRVMSAVTRQLVQHSVFGILLGVRQCTQGIIYLESHETDDGRVDASPTDALPAFMTAIFAATHLFDACVPGTAGGDTLSVAKSALLVLEYHTQTNTPRREECRADPWNRQSGNDRM